MKKFLDEKFKIKIFNFLGISKNIVLRNNYMVIKVFSLKGVKNIENFIEEKLEGQLGELQDLLIHYEILKINKEKIIVIYILKDSKDLESILSENLKVKVKTIQMERADKIRNKLKIKSGLIILKEESNFYVMCFAKGILVNYDETNFLEDINVSYNKELLEKIINEDISKIYVSNEILKEKKKELKDLNLIALEV